MDSWTFKRLFVRMLENGRPFFGDMFHDIWEILKEVFKYFPRRVFRFIVRACEYAPILWNDADYDYSAILRMLQYNIERTGRQLEEHNVLLHSQKYAKQAKELVDLIEIVLTDEYAEAEHLLHDQKWGKMKMVGVDIEGGNGSECRFLRLNVRTKADEEKERAEYRKIMNLEVKRREATWHRLWILMDRNVRNMWD